MESGLKQMLSYAFPIWDEEVMGITDQNKPFKTEETLAARKMAETALHQWPI